jgi:hypothetical protein
MCRLAVRQSDPAHERILALIANLERHHFLMNGFAKQGRVFVRVTINLERLPASREGP